MDPFAPRDDAALDYWFWKFHVGDLAFLVDIIVRRGSGSPETRVSWWVRGSGSVLHEPSSDWSAGPALVRVGDSELGPDRSVGQVGDVQWDLRWSLGEALVSPLRGLVARLEPFDTSIVVWPEARFSGSVHVGAERFDVADVPGSFSHYWGRRLMDRWVWVSASRFEGQPERRLEGIVGAGSPLFGRLPYPLAVAFLWTTDGSRQEEIVSAVTGTISARVTETGVEIVARRFGRPRRRITARWGRVPPNDLGEGIIQTMCADLEVDGVAAVPGSVGLEVRGYPHPRPGSS